MMPKLTKLIALLAVLGLHVFHPLGHAAAMPLCLLVLAGAWLAEATASGTGTWSSTGQAMLGPGTMPFDLGMLVLNAVVAPYLPAVNPAADALRPAMVSCASGPVPSAPQGAVGRGVEEALEDAAVRAAVVADQGAAAGVDAEPAEPRGPPALPLPWVSGLPWHRCQCLLQGMHRMPPAIR